MLLPAERPAAAPSPRSTGPPRGSPAAARRRGGATRCRGGAGALVGRPSSRPSDARRSVLRSVAAAAAGAAAARAKYEEVVTVDEVVVRGSKRTRKGARAPWSPLGRASSARGGRTPNGAIARPSAGGGGGGGGDGSGDGAILSGLRGRRRRARRRGDGRADAQAPGRGVWPCCRPRRCRPSRRPAPRQASSTTTRRRAARRTRSAAAPTFDESRRFVAASAATAAGRDGPDRDGPRQAISAARAPFDDDRGGAAFLGGDDRGGVSRGRHGQRARRSYRSGARSPREIATAPRRDGPRRDAAADGPRRPLQRSSAARARFDDHVVPAPRRRAIPATAPIRDGPRGGPRRRSRAERQLIVARPRRLPTRRASAAARRRDGPPPRGLTLAHVAACRWSRDEYHSRDGSGRRRPPPNGATRRARDAIRARRRRGCVSDSASPAMLPRAVRRRAGVAAARTRPGWRCFGAPAASARRTCARWRSCSSRRASSKLGRRGAAYGMPSATLPPRARLPAAASPPVTAVGNSAARPLASPQGTRDRVLHGATASSGSAMHENPDS